ncbi:MAG: phosphoribosyl-ATP pyrophosphatase, partial [Alphaproteobacteria bacterium]|nr:phosphoribosyl-ATP pyrophosphatase [Alphaproteobacteria bacterium]
LLYHLMVLWAEQDITPDDVFEELAGRAGTSGVEEKESR